MAQDLAVFINAISGNHYAHFMGMIDQPFMRVDTPIYELVPKA
jgi:hypothetical protein